VLVDPSHERAADAVGMTSGSDVADVRSPTELPPRVGLLRIYDPFAAEVRGLPQPQRDHALTQMASTRYARTSGAEMLALDTIGSTLPTGDGVLGDIPLRVLIARGGAVSADQQRQVDAMAELRDQMAAMSSDGQTITLGDASHVSIVTDQQHAAVVTDTIIGLLKPAS
jgi:hypothetical protein